MAGSGSSGYVNAVGTAAQFSQPVGVAVDAAGNIYVGVYASHHIRKISMPSLAVTTLAGGGTTGIAFGFADGSGTVVRFYNPQGVSVDSSGNIYVADNNNNAIRKVTSSGVVTTVAGGGSAGGTAFGFVDGTGTAAKFNEPFCVVLDGLGNLYVSDNFNNAIRKIVLSTSVVTTLAGGGGTNSVASGFVDGAGESVARLFRPQALDMDNSGNIIFADSSNYAVRKVTAAGVVTTVAGACRARRATSTAPPPSSIH